MMVKRAAEPAQEVDVVKVKRRRGGREVVGISFGANGLLLQVDALAARLGETRSGIVRRALMPLLGEAYGRQSDGVVNEGDQVERMG
jgi:hypothetical protein